MTARIITVFAVFFLISILSTDAGENSLRASPQSIKFTNPETCQNDMLGLEDNNKLDGALQAAMTVLSKDFDAKVLDYCDVRIDKGKTNMNCALDYDIFSAEYQQICHDLNATYNPVSMYMQCSSKSSTIEMDVLNTPCCIPNTCGSDSDKLARKRALKVVEAQVKGLDCVFFEKSLTSKVVEMNEGGLPKSASSFQIASISMVFVLVFVMIINR